MRLHSHLISIVVAVTALGCSRSSNKPKCEPTAQPTPKTQAQLPSTSANIFVGNMQATIDSARKVANAEPGVARHCMALSRSLYTKGQYLGDPKQISLAITTLTNCQTQTPNSGIYLARAAQQQSLHQFQEVRADLVRAQELGTSAQSIAGIQRELDWNTGNYDKAIAAIRSNAANSSVEGLSRLALLEHSLGDYDAADAAFELADRAIKNTNPLTIAWLYVQRGHHHMEIGEYGVAEKFFREATERLPAYNAATEHLGEILALQGKYDEAATMYERTLNNSTNPEFMGALASVYEELGRSEDAKAMRESARAGFLRLIETYPDAMGWHAAEFFLEQGADPLQALSLLSANAKLRPNSESWLGLAKAQLATGDTPAAQASIERALTMPLISVDLYETAAAIAVAAGETAAAEKNTKLAEALTDKIRTRHLHCPE